MPVGAAAKAANFTNSCRNQGVVAVLCCAALRLYVAVYSKLLKAYAAYSVSTSGSTAKLLKGLPRQSDGMRPNQSANCRSTHRMVPPVAAMTRQVKMNSHNPIFKSILAIGRGLSSPLRHIGLCFSAPKKISWLNHIPHNRPLHT